MKLKNWWLSSQFIYIHQKVIGFHFTFLRKILSINMSGEVLTPQLGLWDIYW